MCTSDNWHCVQTQADQLNSSTRFNLARNAVRLYPRTEYTDRRAVNTLRRGWIRQILYLGDKWLLARPIHKKHAGIYLPDLAVFLGVIGAGIAASLIGWPA